MQNPDQSKPNRPIQAARRYRSSILRAGLLATGSLLASAGLHAQAVTVPPTTYTAGQPVVVTGASTITNGTNTVTVSANATVIYHATTSVTLKPGFQAVSGSKFLVQISAVLDTDGDGIPDVWEKAHGLNPAVAADAATDLDGDGFSNLSEYRLGTNPAVSNPTDTTNSSNLKVHRPGQ